MKKIYTIILLTSIAAKSLGASFTVSWSGFAFSPSLINAVVGDTIFFPASVTHPLVQVSMTTWNANGTTPLAGGWGTKTSSYMHVITTLGDIYYVCGNHGPTFQMKGRVLVTASSISETAAQKELSVYPNPLTSNRIFFSEADKIIKRSWLNIYSEKGDLVAKEKIMPLTLFVDVDLPSGIYLVNLTTAEGNLVFNQRLVVDRK